MRGEDERTEGTFSYAGETAASAVQDEAQKAGAQASDIGERLYDEGRRAIEEQPVSGLLTSQSMQRGNGRARHQRDSQSLKLVRCKLIAGRQAICMAISSESKRADIEGAVQPLTNRPCEE